MNKKLYIASLLVVFCFGLSYSQDPEPADTTRVNQVDDKIDTNEEPKEQENDINDRSGVVVEYTLGRDTVDTTRNVLTRWITFGLGVNPVHVGGDFDLPAGGIYDDFDLRVGNSTNVDLGIVQNKLNLIKYRLYLKTGLGLDISKYSFEHLMQKLKRID